VLPWQGGGGIACRDWPAHVSGASFAARAPKHDRQIIPKQEPQRRPPARSVQTPRRQRPLCCPLTCLCLRVDCTGRDGLRLRAPVRMALVDTRPRNNLQQHLAWFAAQSPQIPPRGQRPRAVLQTDMRIEHTPVEAPRPVNSSVPTPGPPRPQPQRPAQPAMPREVHAPLMPRSLHKSAGQEVEFISEENVQPPPDPPTAKTIVDKLKSNQHG